MFLIFTHSEGKAAMEICWYWVVQKEEFQVLNLNLRKQSLFLTHNLINVSLERFYCFLCKTCTNILQICHVLLSVYIQLIHFVLIKRCGYNFQTNFLVLHAEHFRALRYNYFIFYFVTRYNCTYLINIQNGIQHIWVFFIIKIT